MAAWGAQIVSCRKKMPGTPTDYKIKVSLPTGEKALVARIVMCMYVYMCVFIYVRIYVYIIYIYIYYRLCSVRSSHMTLPV